MSRVGEQSPTTTDTKTSLIKEPTIADLEAEKRKCEDELVELTRLYDESKSKLEDKINAVSQMIDDAIRKQQGFKPISSQDLMNSLKYGTAIIVWSHGQQRMKRGYSATGAMRNVEKIGFEIETKFRDGTRKWTSVSDVMLAPVAPVEPKNVLEAAPVEN